MNHAFLFSRVEAECFLWFHHEARIKRKVWSGFWLFVWSCSSGGFSVCKPNPKPKHNLCRHPIEKYLLTFTQLQPWSYILLTFFPWWIVHKKSASSQTENICREEYLHRQNAIRTDLLAIKTSKYPQIILWDFTNRSGSCPEHSSLNSFCRLLSFWISDKISRLNALSSYIQWCAVKHSISLQYSPQVLFPYQSYR